jgi:beta propeller repeat protein
MRTLILLTMAAILCPLAGCQPRKGDSTFTDSDSETEPVTTTDETEKETASQTSTRSTGETETGSDTHSPLDVLPQADLEWMDLPQGEHMNCGPKCRRLSATSDVRNIFGDEWDVSERYLVFNDNASAGNGWLNYVVDLKTFQYARFPDPFPEHPVQAGTNPMAPASMFAPTVDGNIAVFAIVLSQIQPNRQYLIALNLETGQMQEVMGRSEEGNIWGYPRNSRYRGGRFVSTSGAGDLSKPTLSLFEPPWPTQGEAIIEDIYGSDARLDDHRVVFWDTRTSLGKITGYDFASKTFFPLVEDGTYQSSPAIHEGRVVYMDYRLGSGDPFNSWESVAIFMKDLYTKATTQITDGKAIAYSPDIHGNIVVWHDYRHCDNPHNKNDWSNPEIYGYNIETKNEFRVTNLPGRPKTSPRVWGDKVFFDMQNSGGGSGIYMIDLPDEVFSR